MHVQRRLRSSNYVDACRNHRRVAVQLLQQFNGAGMDPRPSFVTMWVVCVMCALCALSCGDHAPRPPATRPRLVVLVVIDQLGEWSYAAKRGAAHEGLADVIARGRHFVGRYPFAAALTGPGHAALGTGAPPSVTGVIGNDWYDRDARKEIDGAADAHGDPSPVRLRVDGIADALMRESPGSRAVAVALKSRSAILSLGHHGVAVWFDEKRLRFVSSAPAARPWLALLALAHPVAPYLAAVWEPLDAARLPALSGGPDDGPGELSVPGWTTTFPHALARAKKPDHALAATPFGNTIVTDAAIAAIDGERLGDDEAPDLLIVSYSAHDYVAHAFGPESWEAWDTWMRLDHELTRLAHALDDAAGDRGWALVLTSDHGAPTTPEARRARGLPGARIAYEDVGEVALAAFTGVAGPGAWIASARFPSVFLSDAARALPAELRQRATAAAIAAVAAMPGIGRAALAADLEGDCAHFADDADRATCLSLDRERSGEIVYLPAEGTVLDKRSTPDATDHGSLYDYDRDVPIVVVGPGYAPGDAPGRVSPLQVAPTLARLLGVSSPSAALERPLL
jgi:Type I phosphodiesterase / nucleotide pyrophosphatase